jgi:tripartite-type tricarboxylate transporter receptor subunit TctC
VPAATPKPIVNRLHAELKAVAAMPDIQAMTIRLGAIPVESPAPGDVQKFLAAEIDRWGDIIERAGVARSQ